MRNGQEDLTSHNSKELMAPMAAECFATEQIIALRHQEMNTTVARGGILLRTPGTSELDNHNNEPLGGSGIMSKCLYTIQDLVMPHAPDVHPPPAHHDGGSLSSPRPSTPTTSLNPSPRSKYIPNTSSIQLSCPNYLWKRKNAVETHHIVYECNADVRSSKSRSSFIAGNASPRSRNTSAESASTKNCQGAVNLVGISETDLSHSRNASPNVHSKDGITPSTRKSAIEDNDADSPDHKADENDGNDSDWEDTDSDEESCWRGDIKPKTRCNESLLTMMLRELDDDAKLETHAQSEGRPPSFAESVELSRNQIAGRNMLSNQLIASFQGGLLMQRTDGTRCTPQRKFVPRQQIELQGSDNSFFGGGSGDYHTNGW